jgi:hypothetical protein
LAVAVLYWINHRAGMRLDPGMLWLSLAPAVMCGGAASGTLVVLFLAALLPFSTTLLTPQEREQLTDFTRPRWASFLSFLQLRGWRVAEAPAKGVAILE